MADTETLPDLIPAMARRARLAQRLLARTPAVQKIAALHAAAAAVRRHAPLILAANADDVVAAQADGIAAAMLDRLMLDPARLEDTAAAIEIVADLQDPVGAVIDEDVRPNGLKLTRIRVPLGVVGIIFESRPNVTTDAGALCLKSGNAAILRGGSDAIRTSVALHAAMIEGVVEAGLPADAIQLIQTTDRAAVGAMLAAHGLIDVIIPRGGKTLVARVQAEARVPVLAHLEGLNHSYVDGAADATKACAIVVNAKMRRTGVCGSTETILIDRAFAAAQSVVRALIAAGCEVRGTPDIAALDARVVLASSQDWDTEYLDRIVSITMVDGVDGAIDHIERHGSGHTDAIITEDATTAERFLGRVDSAIVVWNASTQFADGGEFGLGAEIGIATGRLHARGPIALEGLTTYKWQVRGTGQIRP